MANTITESKCTGAGEYGYDGMAADGLGSCSVLHRSNTSLPQDDMPACIIVQPWYRSRAYLFGGWLDPFVWKATILETVGTAFYVYVSGNIATTLGSYETSQTGGYVGFGNIALLSIFVYATASATGGHLNPLITFSTIIAGICPVSRGILYLAGQALGGAIAGGVLTGVYGRERSIEVHGGGCYFDSGGITSGQVFLNEFFACFAYVFLSFGVGLDPKQGILFGPRLAPLLTGGVLGLMTFATSGTVPGYPGAQMNPARCFGYGIARRDMSDQWIWWFAAAAAALLSAALFHISPLHAGEREEWENKRKEASARTGILQA